MTAKLFEIKLYTISKILYNCDDNLRTRGAFLAERATIIA